MRLLAAAAFLVSIAFAQKPGEAARQAEAAQPPEYRAKMKQSHKYAPKPYQKPNWKKKPAPPKREAAQWGVKK